MNKVGKLPVLHIFFVAEESVYVYLNKIWKKRHKNNYHLFPCLLWFGRKLLPTIIGKQKRVFPRKRYLSQLESSTFLAPVTFIVCYRPIGTSSFVYQRQKQQKSQGSKRERLFVPSIVFWVQKTDQLRARFQAPRSKRDGRGSIKKVLLKFRRKFEKNRIKNRSKR